MAHLIAVADDGRDAIAYVGKTPWHGLGQKLPENAPIEVWQVEAGLNYEVLRAPVIAQIPGEDKALENLSALYRSDNKKILSTVSENRYNIVQPAQVLEFFRDLVALKGFHLDVAGALSGGATVWALAKNGRQIRVKGTDIVIPHILLSTDFTGKRGTIGMFTTTRVVCNNTLEMAMHGGESRINVPHFRVFDETDMKRQLGLIDDAIEAFDVFANYSAERVVTRAEATQFVLDLFAQYEEDGKTLTASSEKVVARVVETMRTAPGQNIASANGTAWGLINGVTRYVDFEARSHSTDNRVQSAWFGKGAALKHKAVEKVQELLAA